MSNPTFEKRTSCTALKRAVREVVIHPYFFDLGDLIRIGFAPDFVEKLEALESAYAALEGKAVNK